MDLFVDPSRPRQTTRVLYEQIRTAIASGRVTSGERLPPSRDLATQLRVSRQTITTVYSRLTAEGHTIGRGAAGTYVADNTSRVPTSNAVRQDGMIAARSARLAVPDVATASTPPRFDLRSGTPDLALFPTRAWRRAVTAVLHQPPAGYGNPAGLPELRRALAHQAAKTRSVIAEPDQIVVTSGAQQAIDLTLRFVTRPGDVVAIEEPGYPPVRDLVRAVGCVVAPVPVDADGIRPDLVPPAARVVYTTPSHQSPTGATLSISRRRDLLARAEQHDQLIIEDDYDSEHRHVDRPLEPLHLLDTTGRVVYIATFSKTLSPGLRLGYAVFPPSIAEEVGAMRAVIDVQPPDLLQRAMHRLIVDGELDRHLRRTRRIYRERHGIVGDFVAYHAARGLMVPAAADNAGLHVCARLRHATEAAVGAHVAKHGVQLGAYRSCWTETPDHEGLVLGFGNISTQDLTTALAHVATALETTSGEPLTDLMSS